MLKPREIKRLKSKFVAAAEVNLKEFLVENKAVLSQFGEATIQGLKERDRDRVKEMSYRLISVAKDFGRNDISNLAKSIYRSMIGRTSFDNEDVFINFEESLTKLSNIKTIDPETKRKEEEERRKRREEAEQRIRRNYANSWSDPWQILEVDRNDNMDVVTKAYKSKVKKFHPDVMQSKDLPDEIVRFTEEKFIEITDAYEAIRRHHDSDRR